MPTRYPFLAQGARVLIWPPAEAGDKDERPKPWEGLVAQEAPLQIKVDITPDQEHLALRSFQGKLARLTGAERNAGMVLAQLARAAGVGVWEFQVQGTREEREYVRVDTSVLMRVETTIKTAIQSVAGTSAAEQNRNDQDELDAIQLPELIGLFPDLRPYLTGDDPLHRLLERFARELFLLRNERLARLVASSSDQALQLRKVNLSGNGVKFWSMSRYSAGATLQFDMDLEDLGELKVQGQVLRCERETYQGRQLWGVACKFAEIREEEQERIITFTFKKQRELLRQRRNQTQELKK